MQLGIFAKTFARPTLREVFSAGINLEKQSGDSRCCPENILVISGVNR